jgi:hypothetical protein
LGFLADGLAGLLCMWLTAAVVDGRFARCKGRNGN